MTINIPNTEQTHTYNYLRLRVNDCAYALSTFAVTVDSNATIGNAEIIGTFRANTLYTDYLRGGNNTVNGEIAVTTNVIVQDITFKGNTSFQNDITFSMNVSVINNLNVTNNTVFSQNTSVGKNLVVTQNTTTNVLTVSTVSSLNGNTFANTFSATGSATFGNTVNITGLATIASANVTGTFRSVGAATFSNTVNITGFTTLGQANVTGTLQSVGSATFSNTVNIVGATSLTTITTSGLATFATANVTGTLQSVGSATFSNTASFAGLGTFSSGISVTGAANVTGLFTTGAANVTGTLQSGGAATFGNTISVTGLTSLSTLTTSGLATFATANVTGTLQSGGAATFGNTVNIVGATSLTTITTSGLANLASANVVGLTNLSGGLVVTGQANVSGNTNITGNANVSGNINVTGNSTVGGNQTVSGSSTVNGIGTFNANVGFNGTVTFNGNVSFTGNTQTVNAQNVAGALTVTGNTTLNGNAGIVGILTVSNNASITGNLNVSGSTSIGSTLAVTGLTTLSTANITGISTFNGNSTFGSNISVAGTSNLSTTNINSILTVSANTNLNSNANVAGNLNVSGNLALTNTATFSNTVSISGLATIAFANVTGNFRVGGTQTFIGTATFSNTASFAGLGTFSSGISVTGTATATSFSGSASGLTSIPASQLTGTVPNAAISGSYTGFSSLTSSGNIITGSNLVSRGGGSGAEGGQLTLGYSNNLASNITGEANNTWNIDVSNVNAFRIFRTNNLGSTLTAVYIDDATGNISFANNISAFSFTGSGGGLTSIPAGQLIGTVPNTAISGNYTGFGSLTASGTITAGLFSGSGSSLTSIPAGQLTGTVPNAQISGSYTGFTNINASGIITASQYSNVISSGVIVSSSAFVSRGGGSGAEGGQLTLGYSNNKTTSITGQANNTWNIDVNLNDDLRIFRLDNSGTYLSTMGVSASDGRTYINYGLTVYNNDLDVRSTASVSQLFAIRGQGVGSEGGQIVLGYSNNLASNITGEANNTWNIDVSNVNAFRIFRTNNLGSTLTAVYIDDATGNISFANNISAFSFTGSGGGLTSIPASQLTGTVPNAQISGSYTGFTAITSSGNIITGSNLVSRGGGSGAEGGQVVLGYANNLATGITGQANNSWMLDVDSSSNFRIFKINNVGAVAIPFNISETTNRAEFSFGLDVTGTLAVSSTITANTANTIYLLTTGNQTTLPTLSDTETLRILNSSVSGSNNTGAVIISGNNSALSYLYLGDTDDRSSGGLKYNHITDVLFFRAGAWDFASLNSSGVFTATSFSGSASGLTSIPASQLTGTVPNAAISGSYTGFANVTVSNIITIGNGNPPIISNTETLRVLNSNLSGSNNTGAVIISGNNSALSYLYLGDTDDRSSGGLLYDHSTDTLRIRVGSVFTANIDSSGTLVMGGTTINSSAGNIAGNPIVVNSSLLSTLASVTTAHNLVGTVGLMKIGASTTVPIQPGNTRPGANLFFTTAAGVANGTAASGTWRCLGYATAVNDVTLFVRIS